MWISADKYEKLCNEAEKASELEKEVQRLASLITEKNKDCNIGPWCYDCIHMGTDESSVVKRWPFCEDEFGISSFYKVDCGKVIYCKKYLHKTCPDFILKPQNTRKQNYE